MYEWETPTNTAAISARMSWLAAEVKRITNVTLRGEFVNEEDRSFWEFRAKKLNSELSAIENATRPKRRKA